MSTRLARRIVDKTAAYTVDPTRDTAGTVFTNMGATGSVTFTLPTPSRSLLGTWYEFLGIADQNIVVAPPTADTAIVKNDIAGDSLAVSTAGALIGASMVALCVRATSTTFAWVIYGNSVNHTFTVAT